MRPWSNKSIGLGITGLLLCIVGILLSVYSDDIFRSIIEKEVMLTPSSKAYNFWKDTSALPPMYLEFYFFNWTNPEELKIPGKKPNFVQVGPYAFREHRQRLNITFHPENNTVTFLQRKFWYFDQEKSNGSLDDPIVQLNVVAVSAVHKTRYWSFFMKNSLSMILSSTSSLHINKTVDQLLFSGYDDPLIQMGKYAASGDDVPPYDRFGWFYMRNGSTAFDGLFNMATGTDNIQNLGVLKKWNNKDTTRYYKSPCNVVEGSVGDFWPPFRSKTEISLFSPDLCRPITYEYMKTVSHYGMEGYQFAIDSKTLGNATRRRYPHEQAKYFERTTTTEDFLSIDHSAESTDPPEEEMDSDIVNTGHCYCNGECSPSGLMNVTSCRFGAPAFVSLPHFHKADPILRHKVRGMKPNDEDHSFYITLEPNTAIPLQVAARLQINILLQPSKTVSIYRDVPKLYFPVFWFTMKVDIPENLAGELKAVLLIPHIINGIGISMVVVGTLLALGVILIHFIYQRNTGQLDTKPAPTEKKSELMYLDKVNDDGHVRSDRKLYPHLY